MLHDEMEFLFYFTDWINTPKQSDRHRGWHGRRAREDLLRRLPEVALPAQSDSGTPRLRGFHRMATSETMLAWLKEAGTYALQCEDRGEPPPPLRIDVLISGATIGVRVMSGEKRAFSNLSWPEIERARLNPITQLIDETIAALWVVSP